MPPISKLVFFITHEDFLYRTELQEEHEKLPGSYFRIDFFDIDFAFVRVHVELVDN